MPPPIAREEKTFKSENFSKQSLEGHHFNSCCFTRCDFSESVLRHARFSTCIFTSCNFSLPKLEACRFQDVQFIDCKIVGADFFKCDSAFFSVSFKKCLLSYCNFSDLNMKHTHFDGSKIQEGYFSNTILVGADFADVDLSGTLFHNCDLSKADLSSAVRYSIDPRTNKIKKAKFSLPEAIGLLQAFDITIV